MVGNNIYANDKVLSIFTTQSLLYVLTRAGAQVPYFCYHNQLSIAGNCRVCLIELEGATKLIAACMYPALSGSRVFLDSALTKKARENVFEFLLANHPLDCPICDQGGECDLQDQSFIFGGDKGRFFEKKQALSDFLMHRALRLDMTRCIYCTRCVRLSVEVLKFAGLGMVARGRDFKVSMFLNIDLESNFSINLADICPVGAITAKCYRKKTQRWSKKLFNVFMKFTGRLSRGLSQEC